MAKDLATYKKIYKQLMKEESDIDDTDYGQCSPAIISGGKFRLLLYARDVSSLIHELSHAVFFIFNHCGIKASTTNTEPFCYLIDHLFGEIVKRGKIKLP